MQYLGAISKMTQWSLFISKADQFISQWSNAPTSNAEEAEIEWFYEDLQDLLEWTPNKDVLFITGDWNAKVGSQELPAVTSKFGFGVQNKAGQRLIEFCQENALVIANTLFQPKSDWLYSLQPKMEKLYRVSKSKTRSWLWPRLWTYCKIKT